MHKDRCGNPGLDVTLELNHHLAAHVLNLTLLHLIGEGAVPKATVEGPSLPEISHRMSVPTHCGGKVAVRQLIISSSRSPPPTVFAFFTEAERWAAWQGVGGKVDARAGGALRVIMPDA